MRIPSGTRIASRRNRTWTSCIPLLKYTSSPSLSSSCTSQLSSFFLPPLLLPQATLFSPFSFSLSTLPFERHIARPMVSHVGRSLLEPNIRQMCVRADDRFTWIAFIVQAAVIGQATNQSDDATEGGVAIYWGQSTWLVLAAAVVHSGWGYEAVRWRVALLK